MLELAGFGPIYPKLREGVVPSQSSGIVLLAKEVVRVQYGRLEFPIISIRGRIGRSRSWHCVNDCGDRRDNRSD